MATLYTPNLGLPYPDDNEYLKDVPDFIAQLAAAVDKGRVPAFASAAARTTGLGTSSPPAGTLVFMTDNNPVPRLIVSLGGGNWGRVFPTSPQITTSASAPTGTAETGSIHIQY